MKKHCSSLFLIAVLLADLGVCSMHPPSLHAQSYRYPKFPNSAAQLRGFLPKGYTLIDSIKGDLNQDGTADWIWVAESQKYVRESIDLLGIEPGTLSKPRDLGNCL